MKNTTALLVLPRLTVSDYLFGILKTFLNLTGAIMFVILW